MIVISSAFRIWIKSKATRRVIHWDKQKLYKWACVCDRRRIPITSLNWSMAVCLQASRQFEGKYLAMETHRSFSVCSSVFLVHWILKYFESLVIKVIVIFKCERTGFDGFQYRFINLTKMDFILIYLQFLSRLRSILISKQNKHVCLAIFT